MDHLIQKSKLNNGKPPDCGAILSLYGWCVVPRVTLAADAKSCVRLLVTLFSLKIEDEYKTDYIKLVTGGRDWLLRVYKIHFRDQRRVSSSLLDVTENKGLRPLLADTP